MGLNTSALYDKPWEIPDEYNKVMHFNKLLFEQFSKKQVINVDDILKFIYKNGNIKKDEHVIIFNNHCRGVFGKMPKT